MWIDAHNHLQDARLRETVPFLQMEAAVVNGTTEDDWGAVQALAAEHSWVRPAFGLHPWYLEKCSAHWRERLQEFLAWPGSSIGEVGLDFWMENPQRTVQEEVFRWQLALAAERNLPITIHCLKAFGLLTEILRTAPRPACGFLLHSFSGSWEIAQECLAAGAYFSFSGYFLHEKKERVRAVFQRLPLERVLVETDAPSMPLPAHLVREQLPSGANHPENIAACYEGLAALRGQDVSELIPVVRENFHRLFGF